MAAPIKRKWTVEARERGGAMRRIPVVASDEGQAEAAVRMRGFEVLRVYVYNPDDEVEAAGRNEPSVDPRLGSAATPAVKRRARVPSVEMLAGRLYNLHNYFEAIGYANMVIGFLAGVGVMITGTQRGEAGTAEVWFSVVVGAFVIVAGIVGGFVLWGVGAVFGMLASMGEGVQELVRRK